MKVALNNSNFYYFAFYPNSSKLSQKDKAIAWIGTVALGATLGLGHLICRIIGMIHKKEIESTRLLSTTHKVFQTQLKGCITSLEKAEEAYKNLGTLTEQERLDMAESLGQSWDSLALWMQKHPNDKSKGTLFAKIAQLRGECRWAKENMENSKQLFFLAFECARGNLDFDTSLSLEKQIEKLALDPHHFDDLENAIIKKSIKTKNSLPEALAARHLGYVFMNHKDYQIQAEDTAISKERKIALCENAIALANSIWEPNPSEESKWLQLTCQYNIGPYLYSLRNPEDAKGRASVYEDVLEKLNQLEDNSVKVMQQKAQCYNMLALSQMGFSTDQETFDRIQKSAEIALDFADKGFDLFLSRMFPANRSSFAFKCLEKGAPIPDVTIEKIEDWTAQVLEMCEKEGFSHFYDAIFCLNAAKIAHFQGKMEPCSQHIKKALEICHKMPEQTANILKSIHEFCESKQIEL